MCRSSAAGLFVAVCVVLVPTLAHCATPSAIAELDAQHRLAECYADQARAELDLTTWRLGQLRELKQRGHASWQELAEQEVRVATAHADLVASETFLDSVGHWRSRAVESNNVTQSETIQLYLPQSTRVVAWIPVELASSTLLHRHLQDLLQQHDGLSENNLKTLQSDVQKAERAVEVFGKSPADTDLAAHYRIELRLARAKLETAKANLTLAASLETRIEIVRRFIDDIADQQDDPLALARAGTSFVDASSNTALSRITATMASGEQPVRLQLLRHECDGLAERIDALNALAHSSASVPQELAQVEKRHTDLQNRIRQEQRFLEIRRELADAYGQQPILSFLVTDEPETTSDTVNLASDMSTLRHVIEIERLESRLEASRASIAAEKDYLRERYRRVEKIPEEARQPGELRALRHHFGGTEQRLAAIQLESQGIQSERQRFEFQIRAQRSGRYRLVQAADGGLMSRLQFEMGRGLISAIGFIGTSDFYLTMPDTHPYLESRLVRDCITQLSLRSPGPSGRVFCQTAWGPRYHFLRRPRSHRWDPVYTPVGIQFAVDGITYPIDLYCYDYFALRRLRRDDHWSHYDYLRPSTQCGFRSYYPFGSYEFGLSRPSKYSFRNKYPRGLTQPYGSSYVYRRALSTRSILYSSPYQRPVSPY